VNRIDGVPSEAAELPHIDEHSIAIDTDPNVVWEALLRVVEGSFGSTSTSRVARLLGCADTDNSGPRPLAAGAAFPGFHVELAEQSRTLSLLGSHRYSSYALVFRLDEQVEGHTQLRAETRAEFPGIKGSVYRSLVIGTRGHVLVTRRLLAAIKRRAERTTAHRSSRD
jgi:hypothetical protein